MKRLLALALTILLAVIGWAVAASASALADANQDQAFLVSLGAAGITYKDIGSAIAAGKAVCDMADSGTAGVEVVKVLQEANPALTQGNAAKFTAIAANVYCPTQLTNAKPAAGGGS